MSTSTPPAPLMVGVSGLRGIAGASLTPDVAARFAAALASLVRERAPAKGRRPRRPVVLVARDGRTGGEAWHAVALGAVLAAGCDAIDAGVAMTPTVGVLVDQLGCDAALQVTASHNPQQWNGLKAIVPDAGSRPGLPSAAAPGKALADQLVARFKDALPRAVAWDRMGQLTGPDADLDPIHPGLVARELDAVGLLQPVRRARFNVALDCVGGSGGLLTPVFLAHTLRARADVEGPYEDGLFTHEPEPTREHLTGLTRLVKRARAQVGLAQDPDADRLALVDEKGRYIGEEYTLALAADAALEARARQKPRARRGEAVLVTNLSTSRLIEDVAAAHGARVVRTPVGEANVVEAMKRLAREGRDVVLGGEGNGGVIWPRVTYVRDSLSGIGLVLGLMALRKKTLSELVADRPAYAIEKRKVDLARKEDAKPAVERLARAFKAQRVDLQDGVRIDFDDRAAWVHVRASNTEPIMRLIAEAPTRAAAAALLDETAAVAGA